MIRARTATLAVVLIAVALVSSGCVAIKSESASQRAPGVVTLSLQVCVNDLDGTRYQDCKPPSNTAENDNGQDAVSDPPLPANGQMLVGFRVPDGTTAPGDLPEHDGRLTFASSPGYTSALTAEYLPDRRVPLGGVPLTGFTFDGTTAANFMFTFNPEFGLPSGSDGAPFAGPFRWRAVIGVRADQRRLSRQLAH